MIKKILTGAAIILTMAYFTTGAVFADEAASLSITLNGEKINTCASEQNGSLYLPLRAVSEAIGYPIEWSTKEHTVSVVKPQEKILFDLATFSVTEGDHQYYADSQIINGSLYLSKDFFNDSMGLKISEDCNDKTIDLERTGTNDITLKSVKEISGDKKIDITLQYPQISGLKDKTIENKINTQFKLEAEAAKNEGLKYVADGWDENIPNKFETFLDYRIKYNQNNLLSVTFVDYQYTGGAHGDTIQKSYTFDLLSGKEYSIKDLFKTDANYAAPFNNYIKNEIKARELYELTTFAAISADQAYYLDNTGVTVFFEPYEYFPHAAGIQTFTMDYADLNDMLLPSMNILNKTVRTLESDSQDAFNVGDTGSVVLKGNPTTGYEWHYSIQDNSIITLEKESSVADSDLIGAGSTFTWNFKALKQGETRIVFKYYRSWEGESSAVDTVEYVVKVN